MLSYITEKENSLEFKSAMLNLRYLNRNAFGYVILQLRKDVWKIDVHVTTVVFHAEMA